LNRFVWDMRHATMPGIPNVYIESSYAGHKAIPGTYTVTIKAGTQQTTTAAVIAANPLYPTTPAEYAAYDALMSTMEADVTVMHNLINKLNGKRLQLNDLIKNLTDPKYAALKKEADSLSKDMKAWDEDMVQRKSKAYDDVENFPNKFTANYLFLINQTESDIPRVNQPSLDLKKEYDAQWTALKQRADALEVRLTALNKKLGEAGVGAIWK
jgi:hypothetical protein